MPGVSQEWLQLCDFGEGTAGQWVIIWGQAPRESSLGFFYHERRELGLLSHGQVDNEDTQPASQGLWLTGHEARQGPHAWPLMPQPFNLGSERYGVPSRLLIRVLLPGSGDNPIGPLSKEAPDNPSFHKLPLLTNASQSRWALPPPNSSLPWSWPCGILRETLPGPWCYPHALSRPASGPCLSAFSRANFPSLLSSSSQPQALPSPHLWVWSSLKWVLP